MIIKILRGGGRNPYSFNSFIQKQEKNGYFTEYPISTIILSSLHYLKVKRHLTKTCSQKYGDGQGVGVELSLAQNIKRKLQALVTSHHITATVDGPISGYIENIYKKKLEANNDYFVIIGHPKNLSQSSLRDFETFVSNKELSFAKFSEL